MDRRDVLRLSGALAATAVAGCLQGEDDPTGSLPTGEPVAEDERLAALSESIAGFALDLHEQVADDGNAFLSPYSVSVALAMAYAGARGETREQMAETLHYDLGEDVHAAFGDLEAALAERGSDEDAGGDGTEESDEGVTDEDDGDGAGDDRDGAREEDAADGEDDAEDGDALQLETANAVWGHEGHPFADEYVATLDDAYGAGLQRAAFASDPDGARERINDWVAERTRDRIEDLLPEGAVGSQTTAVIVNAVYFAASWLDEFDPADTEDGTFTALDGGESTVQFMHQETEAAYASLDGVEVLELPYVGDAVSMVLMLPEAGNFEAFERGLDAERLFGIFHELEHAEGEVALPRFRFQSGLDLAEPLAELGMPDAFDRSAADFSGVVEGDSADFAVDGVYHESFVAVDETGTEAAAATSVSTDTSVPPDWGELRFDRPFLFCVRDRPTDAVLFLGRVADAAAASLD